VGEPQTSISTSSGRSICSQNYTNVLSVTRCVQCRSVFYEINSHFQLCLTMKEIMLEFQILTAVVSNEMGNGTLLSLSD